MSLGPGSEVGFYENNNDIGVWTFSDFFKMSCSLYEVSGEESYTALYNWYPQEYQWWITGFVPDKVEIKENKLRQISSVELSNKDMYDKYKNKW